MHIKITWLYVWFNWNLCAVYSINLGNILFSGLRPPDNSIDFPANIGFESRAPLSWQINTTNKTTPTAPLSDIISYSLIHPKSIN